MRYFVIVAFIALTVAAYAAQAQLPVDPQAVLRAPADGVRTLLDNVVNQHWTDNQWNNTTRSRYEYDETNHQSELWSDTWTDGDWALNYHYIYVYDSDDRISVVTVEAIGDGGWIPSSRYEYTYVDGRLSLLLYYDYSETSGQWTLNYRYNYQWTNDLQTQILIERYTDGAWTNYLRETFSYNNQGQEIGSTWSQWDDTGWWDTSAVSTEYSNGLPSHRYYFYDVGDIRILGLFTRTDYTYVDGQCTQEDNFSIDSDWVLTGRRTLEYDGDGNLIHWLQMTNYSGWENSTQAIYAYTTVSQSDPVLPTVALRLTCSPNPVRSGGRISFSRKMSGPGEVTICDLRGREVRRLQGVDGAWNWDGRDHDGRPLAEGVYLLRMTSGGVQATGRALLVR
jgi:hypothetical protein